MTTHFRTIAFDGEVEKVEISRQQLKPTIEVRLLIE